MSTKLKTNEQFLEEFYSMKNGIQEEIVILEEYKNSKTKLLAINKYGLVYVIPSNILKGDKPTIVSAVNKNEYFMRQALEMNPNVWDSIKPLEEYKGYKTKLRMLTKYGEVWFSPYNIMCQDEILIKHAVNKSEYLINQLIEEGVYREEYDYSELEYGDINTRLKILCKIHSEYFYATPATLHKGCGCPICYAEKRGSALRHSNDDYMDLLNKKNPRILSDCKIIVGFIDYKTNIILEDKFGLISVTPASLLGQRNKNSLGYVPLMGAMDKTSYWINMCKFIWGNIYDYSKSVYVDVDTKICVTCKKHGDFYTKPNNHIFTLKLKRGCGCPMCMSSKGEIEIANFLKTNFINFESEYKISQCKRELPLPFDFYIIGKNILIEYQGEQHYRNIEHFGGQDRYNYSKENDEIKRNYCKENNIQLLEIPYWDFDKIEEILAEVLL